MGKIPEFDDEESYLLDFIQSGKRDGQLFDFSYIVVGVGLAIWGLVENAPLIGCAGIVVIGIGFVQRQRADRYWTQVTRRILNKYSEACKPDEEN